MTSLPTMLRREEAPWPRTTGRPSPAVGVEPSARGGRSWRVLSWVLLASCAVISLGASVSCAGRRPPAAPPAPATAVLRYDVHVRVEVDTEARRVAGRAPLDESEPLARSLAPLSHTGLDAHLDLELRPARQFRDGSRSWTVRFAAATGAVLGPAEGDGDDLVEIRPASGWDLAGRSVELRVFDDGEILAVGDAGHVMGPDRLGESLDLLIAMLSPFPPALEAGARGSRQARWPMVLAGARGWRHRFDAQWENLGLEPLVDTPAEAGAAEVGAVESAPQAWRLRYAGGTSTRGRDDSVFPPVGVQARGRIEGEVWLSTVDTDPVVARVLRNRAAWRRTVEVEYPSADGGPLRVIQAQRITALVQRSWP